MNISLKAATTILLLTISFVALAQKPRWLSDGTKDLPLSYIEQAYGEGRSLDEARYNAVVEIIHRRNLATGPSVKIKLDTNGRISVQMDEQLVVASIIRDEHIEELSNGRWRVYILAQTAKHPDNNIEPISITDEYPLSVQCLIPGVRQCYKGQTFKSIAFITAEAACISGIIISEKLRADYSNKATIETTTQQKIKYIDSANNMQDARNIFTLATVAFYAWSLIDACVSRGARHIDTRTIDLVPYANTDGFGLAFNYHF